MIENLFQIGEPAEHRGIVVAPLFPGRDPVAAYLALDDALAGGLRIRETSDSGSVPELLVENPLSERVLLYDGEELVGAKQDRILNVSVLVEAKTTLTIPVSCVEQGRWRHVSPSFQAAGNISHASLRHRKAETQAAHPLARGTAKRGVGRAPGRLPARRARAARPSADAGRLDRGSARRRPPSGAEPAALSGARRGPAAARHECDRLRARARGRAHPALGLPQRGRRPSGVRTDREAEPAKVTLREPSLGERAPAPGEVRLPRARHRLERDPAP